MGSKKSTHARKASRKRRRASSLFCVYTRICLLQTGHVFSSSLLSLSFLSSHGSSTPVIDTAMQTRQERWAGLNCRVVVRRAVFPQPFNPLIISRTSRAGDRVGSQIRKFFQPLFPLSLRHQSTSVESKQTNTPLEPRVVG